MVRGDLIRVLGDWLLPVKLRIRVRVRGMDDPRRSPACFYTGSSSVLFAYSFLLLFGQFDNIYKVEQDSLYFFLEGGFKGIYLREKNFTLSYVVSEI